MNACLNKNLFIDLHDAKNKIKAWRRDYSWLKEGKVRRSPERI